MLTIFPRPDFDLSTKYICRQQDEEYYHYLQKKNRLIDSNNQFGHTKRASMIDLEKNYTLSHYITYMA